MKLLTRISALFAWNVVRQHDGYTYFENAVAGRPQVQHPYRMHAIFHPQPWQPEAEKPHEPGHS